MLSPMSRNRWSIHILLVTFLVMVLTWEEKVRSKVKVTPNNLVSYTTLSGSSPVQHGDKVVLLGKVEGHDKGLLLVHQHHVPLCEILDVPKFML